MSERLENDVSSVRRPVAVPTHRGQRECVRGTLGKIEAALGRQIAFLGVGKALPSRVEETVELPLVGGLTLERAGLNEVVQFF